jgi:hypothetical protein
LTLNRLTSPAALNPLALPYGANRWLHDLAGPMKCSTTGISATVSSVTLSRVSEIIAQQSLTSMRPPSTSRRRTTQRRRGTSWLRAVPVTILVGSAVICSSLATTAAWNAADAREARGLRVGQGLLRALERRRPFADSVRIHGKAAERAMAKRTRALHRR